MSGHVAPKSLYYMIFLALMIGTIITVAVAFVDLGYFNNVVMLTIACAKALLVVLFFMHVRWSTRLTWVVVGSGFFWLMIMFVLTMSDYLSRGWMPGSLR
jgi:cytochrome c oxidase subunit 4